MPIYTYQAKGDEHCMYCYKPFDRVQKMDAPRLTACPECGSALRRVIAAPNLATSSANMSEENIGKKGFTQYKKLEKGVYEKTVGKGPDIITDKD